MRKLVIGFDFGSPDGDHTAIAVMEIGTDGFTIVDICGAQAKASQEPARPRRLAAPPSHNPPPPTAPAPPPAPKDQE